MTAYLCARLRSILRRFAAVPIERPVVRVLIYYRPRTGSVVRLEYEGDRIDDVAHLDIVGCVCVGPDWMYDGCVDRLSQPQHEEHDDG